MPEKSSIDLCNVSFKRGGRTILHDISLSIGRGELVAMVGLNGAGKTTLLSLLATLAVPESGHIFVDNVDVVAHPAVARTRIGVVFQTSALEPRLSARDNLWFIARCQGLKGRAVQQRINELLTTFGLEAQAQTPVQWLSGGQCRRLELARALIARPPVLLLDEATLGLDIAARRAFWAEIRTLVDDGHTVLCSTHHTEEARDADRVVVLHQGRLLAGGPWPAMHASVPGTIRLRVPDIAEAQRWLAAHGYPVEIGDDNSIIVSGTDPQAVLPALLQRIPCRVLGADIAAPDLMDVVGHWIAAQAGDATRVDAHLAGKVTANVTGKAAA
ncbi:MAG: ABC transporter ATP-binding protein [Paraburkholderia sp.]|uniref:ABC transporter ATP-binding protein n=1 Tax=Paraburkholderia sp. TaxID=1926495 RepID=UPI00121AFBEE|nr:ABC transporter ATP-binding protein [Paraburkholderia sp.]TAM07958.1 MAG: ABC transporter ATP-binding protein [Paraburkholderia sp.]TAM31824.1 MAG: ABC transporter ATP-binding protein [Paraburkholderia sp.]